MSSGLRFVCLVLPLSILCAGCGGGVDGSTSAAQNADLLSACSTLSTTTGTTPISGSIGAVIDEAVTSEMAAKAIPAMTVTIAKKGVVLYSRGYGYADLTTCRPAQSDTVYQIGSVTKQFTAAAILQLQAAGKLNIDDKVQRYLPDYAFDSRLTLRTLLNQTSGLPDYAKFDNAAAWITGVAQADVLKAIVNAPKLFSPGAAYSYSNSNYFILAVILEVVTKTSYADYLSRHIFQPLGLNHTFYATPSNALMALPYTTTRPLVSGSKGLAAGIIPDPSFFSGAGALWSSGEDLAKWNAALLDGAVISPELLSLAVTPPASVPIFQNGTTTPYAMGLLRGSMNGRSFVWHNGRTYAYTAFNGMFLDDGFSLSILTNINLQEETPLLSFAQKLMQKICSGQGTAAGC